LWPRAAVLKFFVVLGGFWFVANYFGITANLAGHLPSAIASFSVLLAPYWAFGFGLDAWLRKRLSGVTAKTLAPLVLMAAYLVFVVPRGQFRWSMFLGMTGIVLAIALLLSYSQQPAPAWNDWAVLAMLGISVDLHFFDAAWAVAGLTGMPKLLFVDVGLYGFLVLRPIEGIGFDLRVRRADLKVGVREFLYFTPIALLIGFTLRFLHFHAIVGNPLTFGAGWLFTLFFVALPEELFFRGLMLNLLERRFGTRRALVITSLLFGLAHFNKRAAYFNWRYVILAAIAGIFYGRAWLARSRLIASSITHATVDTAWSIWLR
jgi:membrane protease YdiL (CAAX protease family)